MKERQDQSHALYVKWGRFQAGAFGWPAVIVLAIICVAGVFVLIR
jgi:hypothetical protein